MVKVNQLSKFYGQQKALDAISFEVQPGTILGFLGPNGAGKSTTMKILTGFIPQTSGTASLGGFDINTHSMEVRRIIGYLPENTPLYTDMYVKEYLSFIAGVHAIPKAEVKQRVEKMIAITGLDREQKKKISELSKGYKQRVGLAQALIHDPKILILDEPTSGLDPNQLSEIRGLIKELGRDKIVILSTHIMQEVEAVCDRVIIINQGKIVANDSTKNLLSSIGKENLYHVEFNKSVDIKALQGIPGVKSVKEMGASKFTVSAESHLDIRDKIFDFAVKNNLVLLSLEKQEGNLEEVFRTLTKK